MLTREQQKERKLNVYNRVKELIVLHPDKSKMDIFQQVAKEFGYNEPNSISGIYYSLKKMNIDERLNNILEEQSKFKSEYRRKVKHRDDLWGNLHEVRKGKGVLEIVGNYPFSKRISVLENGMKRSGDLNRVNWCRQMLWETRLKHKVLEELFVVNGGKLIELKNFTPNQLLMNAL